MSKDVNDIILERLGQIEAKVDKLMSNGCAKADQHDRFERGLDGVYKRISSLEESRAEGKGKIAVAVAVASTGLTLFVSWIGKQF
jgi:hypothetical protein